MLSVPPKQVAMLVPAESWTTGQSNVPECVSYLLRPEHRVGAAGKLFDVRILESLRHDRIPLVIRSGGAGRG